MILVEDKSTSQDSHVTVTHGIRGYYAVLLHWCSESGGFWEPWSTGVGSYDNAEDAIPEAREWAEEMGVSFHPPMETTS